MRRLLSAFLVSLVAACGATDRPASEIEVPSALEFHGAGTEVDLSMPDVDAIGYELELALDDATPGRETFQARSGASLVATRELDAIELDFEGHTIDEVRVGTTASAANLEVASYRRSGAKLVVPLTSPLPKGRRAMVEVRYHGVFAQVDGANPNDFFSFGGLMARQNNAEGKRIFATLAWPSKGRRIMPLRDHPRDGAMIAMKLTFPATFTVLSNGDRKDVVVAGGARTWSYEALTPMPPYDFHFSAYEGWVDREVSASSGVTVASHLYARDLTPGTRMMSDVPKAVDFYEQNFGRYRFGAKATFVEVPIFGGGMEHATVVSLDETLFEAPEPSRHTTFHELAHHWSGNLVRIRTWNDFWLSEGFTDYLMARFVAHHDGAEAGRKMWGGLLKGALAADGGHALRPGGRDESPSEVEVLTIFDDVSYKKGARVMRMLESVVGEQALTTFLKSWFERNAFKAVTTPVFERELSAETGKDLRPFFDQFVYGKGAPEVNVSMVQAAGNAIDVTVEQSGPASASFPVELALKSSAGEERVRVDVAGARTTKRIQIADGAVPTNVIVDPDDRLYGITRCDAVQLCKTGSTCQAGACSF